MNLNRLATFVTLSASLGCGSLPPAKEITDQRSETGRQVCENLGLGIHQFNGEKLYCFYPQGGFYNYSNFDMPPEAKPITLADLPNEIKGKRVVLFGEDHGKADIPAAELVEIISQEGFDYIGLELDQKRFQPLIDAYYASDDIAEVDSHFGQSQFRHEIIALIVAAKAHDIPVKCIDNRESKNYKKDDNKNFWDRREELIYENISALLCDGKRMALVMGGGHITHNVFSDFFNGETDSGWPNSVRLNLPTGHRLAREYGLDNVYSVGLDSDSKGTRFIDAYLVR